MSIERQELRILICPNAFKGSLTAAMAARVIAAGIATAVKTLEAEGKLPWERVETACLPLADGGDGTLETLVEATGGTLFRQWVRGPLGRPVEASWGRLGGSQRDTAVIEMAQASGLRLLEPGELDPLTASTFGTGELMRAAVEAGCRRLIVGIGGSATNDGGAGMAQALGIRFLDGQGQELPPGGAALTHLAKIVRDDFCLPTDTQVIVACDVDNPLCGPEGASAIYGPQKGATPERVPLLDNALAHFAQVIEEQGGVAVREVPGAGAAGGLGAGLMAFCGATLQRGTEMVLEVTDFDHHLSQAHLVITGEGRLDGQTARGKVIAGVVKRAKAAGVPVIALAGSVVEGAERVLRQAGLTAALSCVNGPLRVEEAMQNGKQLLSESAERLLYLLALCLP